jgi:phosphatidylserine decarboxylase
VEGQTLKIAKGSTTWISLPILLTAILASVGSWYASAIALAGTLFVIFFHRDPDRAPQGDGMVSPADGRVVTAGPEKIAIFMGANDVHVNRSPLDGLVKSTLYTAGGHYPAFLNIASKNQRNEIVIGTVSGDVAVSQIAGALVRRIACYVKPGDRVVRGQRIGMIHFGSRVEVTIPRGYRQYVDIGDRVRAGESIIAVKDQ